MNAEQKLEAIREILLKHGQVGTYSGKAWVIDQIARLAASDYEAFMKEWERMQAQEDPWADETTYVWDKGIKPR